MTSLPLLLLGAACSASLSVGCLLGCDPGTNGYRAPVELTPQTTTAIRTPVACGAVAPALTQTAGFSLALTGDANVELDVPASVATNVAIPLTVSQGAGSNFIAQSSDGAVFFTFVVSNAATLDTTALDSVVVTVTSLPSSDGELLGAELNLRFDDGRTLDQVYSAPLQTTSCH